MTRLAEAASFYARPSLHVEVYDALTRAVPGGDDIGFIRGLAETAPGPILELGCGTGRVAIPLAEAGHQVVGLDRSRPMLDLAERRRRSLAPEVRRRLRFVEADMTDFRLRARFGLAFAAFRVFMCLLDPASQRAALERVRRHLHPDGLLVIDVFDPLLDRIAPGPQPTREVDEVRHPDTGRRVRVVTFDRVNDPVKQRMSEDWRFTELDDDERIVREDVETLTLRWTFRHELRHLLALAGFEVTAEWSDYAGSPPAYGREIIIVARRDAGRR
jgi:SAM-dependent methyltransferase